MKARALIDGAPFGPETAKAIGEAFDQASKRINRIFGNDTHAVEAASVRFAEAILSVATEGNTDVEDLKNRASVSWPGTTAHALYGNSRRWRPRPS
jgi:hypothetical protein